MKRFSTTILLTLTALVHCEPPVPQGQYLPPSSSYGAPSGQHAPSSSYGAPRGGSFGAPSSSYGAPSPSNSYGAPSPSSSYGAPSPSSSYGAPSPSSSYGAPSPSSSYGAPSGSHSGPSSSYGAPSGSHGGPSSSYGAPAVTSAIFSKPQSTYGAPSQQGGYGGGSRGSGYGGSNGGGYGGYGEENYGPAKYEFQYDVQDYQSGQDFGHMESRDGDRAVGRYYVLLPDGRKQIVNYEADEHGYRPTISYEQTGGSGGGFGGYDNNAQSKFNGY